VAALVVAMVTQELTLVLVEMPGNSFTPMAIVSLTAVIL
jgi:hypothetical protein